jgi:hypothetical protein
MKAFVAGLLVGAALLLALLHVQAVRAWLGFDGGGRPPQFDEQPPITVADGSVALISKGKWRKRKDKKDLGYFVSELNDTDLPAKVLEVALPGSPDFNCSFYSTKLDLVGGDGQQTETYVVDIVPTTHPDKGKVEVLNDPSNKSTFKISPDGHTLEFTLATASKVWNLESIDNNGAPPCSAGANPMVAVIPH